MQAQHCTTEKWLRKQHSSNKWVAPQSITCTVGAKFCSVSKIFDFHVELLWFVFLELLGTARRCWQGFNRTYTPLKALSIRGLRQLWKFWSIACTFLSVKTFICMFVFFCFCCCFRHIYVSTLLQSLSTRELLKKGWNVFYLLFLLLLTSWKEKKT